MQQNTFKILFLLTLGAAIITELGSCWKKPDSRCGTIKTNYTATYKFNEIGILGDTSSTPYIEVQYTVSNSAGNNQVLTQWVTPPCLIGGYPVVCNYDSGYDCADGQVISISPHVKISYGTGGAEFMKIINHSTNTLEYFIAGTQDTSTISLHDYGINVPNGTNPPSTRTTVITPFVQYNNAPIYYLLNPDKKPNTNLYSLIIDDNKNYTGKYNVLTLQSNPNQIGNLQVSQAWSIGDVMKLYRAEYRQSTDTILTLCFDDFIWYPAGQPLINRRLSAGVSGTEIQGLSSFPLQPKNVKFYGFIQANGVLQSSDSTPLISHYVWDNTTVK